MSISLNPQFTYLKQAESKVQAHKEVFENVYQHQKIIHQIEAHLKAELGSQVTTFNWEKDPEKKALLDQLYDHHLITDWSERQYAFTKTDEVFLFMQKIKAALEKKSQEAQDSYQLYNSEKEKLMQYYHELIDIISKLAQIVSFLSQRI